MLKLTHDNYFTEESKALTNSKIGDWKKCPNYFKRKHITHEIEKEDKACFATGSAVDGLLTKEKVGAKYHVMQNDGRTALGKQEKAEALEAGKQIVTQAQYDEIMGLAIAVEETDAYKFLHDFETQKILQVKMDLGEHFDSIAGIPDFFKIDKKKGKCILVDLKTAKDIDEKKYFYHCRTYGYFRQLAMYELLIEEIYGIDHFESYHLAVEKTKNIWPVEAFLMPRDEIEYEKRELEKLFLEIKEERDFAKKGAAFETAIKLKDPSYE